MDQIFIRLYMDEDVSAIASKMLAARGFEVITTQQAGKLGTSDADQLAYATEQGMSLLTHNRADFEALARQYAASGTHHAGLLIAVRRPPRELVARVLRILNQTTADEMINQIRLL